MAISISCVIPMESSVALAIPAAHAAPVNLSSWSALTLNFPGGQGAGNWALEPGNTAVQQTINADPSFFLNNSNNASYTMRGNWQVLPAGAGDDDYMGFVFGYAVRWIGIWALPWTRARTKV